MFQLWVRLILWYLCWMCLLCETNSIFTLWLIIPTRLIIGTSTLYLLPTVLCPPRLSPCHCVTVGHYTTAASPFDTIAESPSLSASGGKGYSHVMSIGNCGVKTICTYLTFQTINFKFIPVAHQLNFVLIVSLGWATFLSLFNAKRDAQKKE